MQYTDKKIVFNFFQEALKTKAPVFLYDVSTDTTNHLLHEKLASPPAISEFEVKDTGLTLTVEGEITGWVLPKGYQARVAVADRRCYLYIKAKRLMVFNFWLRCEPEQPLLNNTIEKSPVVAGDGWGTSCAESSLFDLAKVDDFLSQFRPCDQFSAMISKTESADHMLNDVLGVSGATSNVVCFTDYDGIHLNVAAFKAGETIAAFSRNIDVAARCTMQIEYNLDHCVLTINGASEGLYITRYYP